MMAFHADTPELQELLFLGIYLRGIYMAPRGMINLSLPVTDDQLAALARRARRQPRRAGSQSSPSQ